MHLNQPVVYAYDSTALEYIYIICITIITGHVTIHLMKMIVYCIYTVPYGTKKLLL